MANQTVTTIVNYDDAAIYPLLNGETITINGGSVTINADVRWNQQAAVFGNVTLSSSLGGSFIIDGTTIWEIPFSASTGNVPTQNALGSNGVTGGTSGATGELTRVWATGSFTPATAGEAMPGTGYIKLRTKTGTFQNGETITLPGGATVTASSAGKRSWINVVARSRSALTLTRLGFQQFKGDWYEIGTTDGTDNQIFQLPFLDGIPAIQVETGVGTGIYEWWPNVGAAWTNYGISDNRTTVNTTTTSNNITGPTDPLTGGFFLHGTRVRETITNAAHNINATISAQQIDTGNTRFIVTLKKETRRHIFVQAHSGANRYGVLVDLNTGTIITTSTIGSPTGTSNAITALSNGWYEVELTLDHVVANSGGCYICLSNSSTPDYNANGQPTYAGTTTEGVYYSDLLVLGVGSQIATDTRGKLCFSNATNGTVKIAERGTYHKGYKPVSGCKVRIPNVILSSAHPINYDRNITSSRYTITTTAATGSIDFEKVIANWSVVVANCFSVSVVDSASLAFSFSNVGSAVTYLRNAGGLLRASGANATFTNCFVSGDVSNNTIYGKNVTPLTLSGCRNFTVNENYLYNSGSRSGRYVKANQVVISIGKSQNVILNENVQIGGEINLSDSANIDILNIEYADVMVGETTVNAIGQVCNLNGSVNINIEGLQIFYNLSNVHHESMILSTGNHCSNVKLRNMGSISTPFGGGSVAANRMLRVAILGSTTTGIQNSKIIDVWGDGNSSTLSRIHRSVMYDFLHPWRTESRDINRTSQGRRYTQPTTTYAAVYGTHWEDVFINTTEGRLIIFGNEPTTATVSQCSTSFGTNAGFTSAGTVSLPNLVDTIIWTMPYYALGHTSIATFNSAITNQWLVTGTNVQYLEFEYQINTGSGFSAWKHLLNQGTRSAGGLSGTNTVTLNSTEFATMIRTPQIGDVIQTATNKLPANTTITNIVGNVITVHNNFTSAVSAGELILFWNDIKNETINPSTGYKLKVRLKVNTANTATVFTQLRIPFDTNSINKQQQYPLLGPTYTLTIINIISGSNILIKQTNTNTVLFNEIVSGTTFTYIYDYIEDVDVEIVLRKASEAPYYQEWRTTITLTNSNNTQVANQI